METEAESKQCLRYNSQPLLLMIISVLDLLMTSFFNGSFALVLTFIEFKSRFKSSHYDPNHNDSQLFCLNCFSLLKRYFVYNKYRLN